MSRPRKFETLFSEEQLINYIKEFGCSNIYVTEYFEDELAFVYNVTFYLEEQYLKRFHIVFMETGCKHMDISLIPRISKGT